MHYPCRFRQSDVRPIVCQIFQTGRPGDPAAATCNAKTADAAGGRKWNSRLQENARPFESIALDLAHLGLDQSYTQA